MKEEELCSLLPKIAEEIVRGQFSSREELLDKLEEHKFVEEKIKYVLAFLFKQNESMANYEERKQLLEPELEFLREFEQFYWRQDPSAYSEGFYTQALNVLKILWHCQVATLEEIRPVIQSLYFSGQYYRALESLMELIPAIGKDFSSDELIDIFQEFGIPFPQSEDRELWDIVVQQPSLAPSKLGLLVLQRPEYVAEIIEAHDFQELWSGIEGKASHEFLSSLIKQVIEARAIKLLNAMPETGLTPDEAYDQFEDLLTLDRTIIPLWYPELIKKLQNKIQPYAVAAEDLSEVPKKALQLSLLKKGFQRQRKQYVRIHNLGGPQIGHSSYIIEYGSSKILLDFGLSVTSVQFPSWLPSLEFLDAICISHGHLDHLGGLPFLFRQEEGLDCQWYATSPTETLAKLLLLDNRNLSKKRMKPLSRFSHPTLSHCVKKENVSRALEAFSPLAMRKSAEVAPDIFVTAIPAGHIPGSVSYLIEVDGKKILYSGDFNLEASPLFPKAIHPPVDNDVTIFDGTYFAGEDFEQANGRENLIQTVASSERAIIPAFSVGRTQEVIQILSEAGLDKEKDIVTTGMAGNVCKTINLEGRYRIQPGYDYNSFEEGSVFVGGSGMLQGGVARELVNKTRDDPKTAVILCGYLAPRTLGSDLRNGRARSFYSQNIVYARISAHSAPKPLDKFIDTLEGEKYAVHVGAISGLKPVQEILRVKKAGKEKGLKIFSGKKPITINV
ncbi:MAG: MBL fold metallo-hydrolase [Candidatus Hodarchaeota archaeon]